MVGLEIHQQLATGKKLFCGCPSTVEPDSYPVVFRRRLRPSAGETGLHDAAALFEGAKARTVTYYANPNSSCLVEQDEEPPHELDSDAKSTTLIIASALRAGICTELHTMRKTVIDGSNTTGFQRTMLVSQGGSFEAPLSGDGKTMPIGIQSVCLEEDAARILDPKAGGDSGKGYGLERLGIPLVEIATEPFEVTDPGVARDVALSLGRILRSTKRVVRGLGSIRQDVNVSIAAPASSSSPASSSPPLSSPNLSSPPPPPRQGRVVVEVKGVQQLDQLADVISYEAHRQHGMLAISEKLRDCKWSHDPVRDRADATVLLGGSPSKIVQRAIKSGHAITAVAFRGSKGVFGYSPHPDVRLGREVADLVKLFGIGGVFHSDELPAYGITDKDVAGVAEALSLDMARDAFLMFAAPEHAAGVITDQIVSRVGRIASEGIPADTRLATPDGKTSFMRPRPGAARMYPETDVPTVTVTKDELARAAERVPKRWDESISDMQSAYGINAQLAEQLWDSPYADLFERIISAHGASHNGGGATAGGGNGRNESVSPAFVASTLCSTITSIGRQKGTSADLLTHGMILDTFGLLGSGKIAKESVEMIFQKIMSGQAGTVADAAGPMTQGMKQDELAGIIRGIIRDNTEIILNQRERAAGPLMGIVMKRLRGRASGKAINALVVDGISEVLRESVRES